MMSVFVKLKFVLEDGVEVVVQVSPELAAKVESDHATRAQVIAAVKKQQSTFVAHQRSTSVPVSHQQVTSVPVSHQQVTSVPVSHQQVTSVPVSHQQVTSVPVSHQQVTSVPVSRQQATSVPVSHQQVTSVPVSHQQVTPVLRQQVTSVPLSRQQVTSVPLSRQQVTSVPVSHQQVASHEVQGSVIRAQVIAAVGEQQSTLVEHQQAASLDVEAEELVPAVPSNVSPPAPENGDDGTGKSLYIWSSQCVLLLLAKYHEHEDEFSAGIKRHNKIWETIAAEVKAVNPAFVVTGAQCKTKLSGLKRTYKGIVDHNAVSGNDRKTWPFFKEMDEIFGREGWANPKATASEAGPDEQDALPAVPDSFTESSKPPPAKKKKASDLLEKYLSKRKEMEEGRAKQGVEKEGAKERMFQELLAQRERQHQEKMTMLSKMQQMFQDRK